MVLGFKDDHATRWAGGVQKWRKPAIYPPKPTVAHSVPTCFAVRYNGATCPNQRERLACGGDRQVILMLISAPVAETRLGGDRPAAPLGVWRTSADRAGDGFGGH